MPFVAAKCTQCGASLEVDNSKDTAICSACQTPFIVEKAINNYNTSNNTTNNITQNITDSVVHIHGENSEFDIRGGVLIAYNGSSMDVKIPDNVAKIGEACFAGMMIKSVAIPDSVMVIGGSAFRGCTVLTEAAIPAGVSRIGQAAFSNCKMLTEVRIPSQISTIEKEVFSGCIGLKEIKIPDSVQTIGTCAFSFCTGLTHIVIPQGIETIPVGAFSGCTNLTDFTIPDSVTSIESIAFEGCTRLSAVLIPDSVTSIGSRAFAGCEGLTTIVIPDSLKEIGDRLFSNCTGLRNVTLSLKTTETFSLISSGRAFSGSTFEGCTAIDLVITGSVKEIRSDSFTACQWLSKLTILDGVTKIGMGAFRDCTGLTSVSLPDTLQVICGESDSRDSGAFENCTGLTHIRFSERECSFQKNAFRNCTGLTSITLPSSIKHLNYKAVFCGCSNIKNITMGKELYYNRNKMGIPNNIRCQLIPDSKSGCYVATAVYGSYNAPEVLVLRRFRDECLAKSVAGRAFIKAYYRLSPPVAEWLKNAKRTNRFVRLILNSWVSKLEKQIR